MTAAPYSADAPGEKRLRETEDGVEPPSEPEISPAGVAPPDPVSPASHADGGTYAESDYSVAARRSQVRVDQLERPPGPEDTEAAQRSGFAGAEGQEGPASVAGGH